MLTLFGSSMLSDFNQQKLLQRLARNNIHASHVNARYVHFVDVNEPLTEEQQATLASLLTYGPAPKTDVVFSLSMVVAPRAGTISPWSTKATNIANNCGLGQIMRIERGIQYSFDGVSEADIPNIAAHIHDRMTEMVLADVEQAEALFVQHDAKPLNEVDVLGQGRA
ncbi:MAG: phosphoribosylformylglycinamidine synthase, partial [Glaciecola sp.]